jgi:AraC family transcriptional regulator
LVEIAVDLERALTRRALAGEPGNATERILASGNGWRVSDVVCTSGPQDRPFEEHHSDVSIAIVAVGTFQYRSKLGRAMMTPGSLLLGNAGHCFECSHEHGAGDRCVSFHYSHDFFERLARDAGASGAKSDFPAVRIPPVRELSTSTARALACLTRTQQSPWEEIAIQLAGNAVRIAGGVVGDFVAAPPGAMARVTRTVRAIERDPEADLSISARAGEAGLSPYHFLRLFERLTGLTPHQYVLRLRLREAARRLMTGRAKVLDVALDSGFGDVSNFNRAFRAEFGSTPREFRRNAGQIA